MLGLMAVFAVCMIIIYKSFFIVNIINKKDNQNIKNKSLLKLVISFFTSIVASCVYLKYGFTGEFITYLILIVYVTLNAYIDFYTGYIYEFMSLIFIGISVIITVLKFINGNTSLENLAFSIIAFVIVAILSKLNLVGAGDIEVFIVVSLLLNKTNIIPLLNLILSFGISGIMSLFLIIVHRKKINSRKPLGPSIALSTFILLVLM